MSVSLSIDGPGDAELISAVRGGDIDAYGELFARHVDAARRLARQLAGPGDADDLVSDAFTKVLTVLQRGGGPDLAFRAYLLTAVRRLHVDKIRAGSRLRPVDDLTPFDPGLPFQDTAVEGFENAAAARAFASLPERWQMVLWHTEVEQQKPADIAPLLGMSANSVSALAYRAREGLRQAFLSQHATDPDDVDCAWTRDHMGAYVRGGLSRRDAGKVDDHLAACRACAAVYLELTEVNSGLAALLAPLLLGSAGAGYLSSGGLGSGGALSGGFTAAKTWAASHASLTAVGGMLVTATAILSIYGATHFNGHSTADLGSPPALNRPPAASTQPATGNDNGRGPGSPDDGRGLVPAAHTSTEPSNPTQSTPPTTPVSSDSTAPVIDPNSPPTSEPTDPPSSDPTTGPTDPTTGPTDPTTGPTDPTTGPTDPTTGPTTPGEVAFDSTAPDHPAIGTTYRVHATGGSGGTIIYSVDSSTTHDACSVAGDVVSFDHAGTCVVAAHLAADGVSRAATGVVTQSIEVPQTAQTVSFSSSEPSDAAVDGSYDANASSSSERPVTLAVDAATTNDACALSGTVVSFHHAGTCVVTATQVGDADLATATATQTIPVAMAAQTVKLTLDPDESAAAVGDSVSFTASGGRSGKEVVVTTNNADVCAVVGSKVSFLNPGACTILADQAGNLDYEAAPTVTRSVNVVQPPADLRVTAEVTGLDHFAVHIRATIVDLPPGAKALLTVDPEGNYDLKPVDDQGTTCDKTGPASYTCTVTGTATGAHVDFDVNVHNDSERAIDFAVEPVAPLTDPNPDNNTFRLQLGD